MLDYVITAVLVSMSGLFSGLTLGLMSLGPHELKRKMELGDQNAKKVYPIRVKGNLLLVTLLLGNVVVNTTLSIFLGSIASGLMAGIIATSLIVVFGEITPQAIFSRYALQFGAKTAWLVRLIVFILYPICRPIAWVLDRALGEELPTVFSKRELVEILKEHKVSRDSDVQDHEQKIAAGALTFGQKNIGDVMTPRSQVVILDANDLLDEQLVHKLKTSGHSRFPVKEESVDSVTGTLYLHDIVGTENLESRRVGELAKKPAIFINEANTLDDAFQAFLKTKHHLFVVVNEFQEVVGVISIEDVLEEIIQSEIVDEFDKYDDLRAVAKRKTKPGVVTGA